jgi:YHS domain-containing protein
MKTDPVCGMSVDEKTAKDSTTYQGTTYYFCSPDCKRTFEQQPEKYASKEGKPQKAGTHA